MNTAINTDIDIDFADRNKALEGLVYVSASRTDSNGRKQRHPSGVYFQNVPSDPFTGLCAYDYEEAEQFGYFKLDFLNNSLYEGVRDEDHLSELLNKDPDWSLLEHEEIVGMLAHVGNHFGVMQHIKPTGIEDLAVVLALMRPGKRHLMGRTRDQIDADIWTPGSDGFTFKRAHAIAYAASIVVQLNLIIEATGAQIDAEAGE